MLFGGGLVPSYILMTKYLALQNTYGALVLSIIGNVWYLFIMRTFFQQLPNSLVEAAKIEGAGELTIYLRIIIPLSKPVLASVAILETYSYWNSWMPAMLYVSDKDMYPLQYQLQKMLADSQEAMRMASLGIGSTYATALDVPLESGKMAMCVFAIVPMIILFLMFQRYFVKGLTVGSVKG